MKNSNIYPGTYTLLPEAEVFLQQLKSCHTLGGECRPVIIDEIEGCYYLTLAIPGLKKENIVVHSHGNTISVANIPRVEGLAQTNYEEEHILLPADADTEFVNATYREGVLHFYIPKVTNHPQTSDHEIIVY